MSGVPWPDENPGSWNTCLLGKMRLPGLTRVHIELEDSLDVKKPQGGHGATITRQGYQPAKVSLLLRMWEARQFEEFQALVSILRPRVGSGREAKAVEIVHPKTLLWGVRAVIVQRIKDQNGDQGDLYDIELECIEHFPPPKGASGKATKTDKVPEFRNQLHEEPKPPTPPSETGNHP